MKHQDKIESLLINHLISYGHFPTQAEIGASLGVTRARAQVLIRNLAAQGKIQLAKDRMTYDYRKAVIDNLDAILKELRKR